MNLYFIKSIYLFFSDMHPVAAILSFLSVYFVLHSVLILWLWLVYDRPIKRIHNDLLDTPARINENNRGRGVVTSSGEQQIRAAEKPLEIELKRRRLNRELFVERVHLLSFFKK